MQILLSSHALVTQHLTRTTPRRSRVAKAARCSHQDTAPDDVTRAPRASDLSSTLELLNNAQPFLLKSLDQAEDELQAYCSMLSDDESAGQCWEAYSYLEDKRKEAEEGCAWELTDGGRQGPHCARLQALEQLTYELIGSGEVSGIVSALATLSRAEKKMAAKRAALREGEAVAFIDEGDIEIAKPQGEHMHETMSPDGREQLRALFLRVDHNHDGKLDMEEFRQAMRLLGDELDGHTVAVIGEVMDAHGQLDEDQFVQVVEAEAMSSHSAVARMWRQHPITSRWWGQEHYSKGSMLSG